MRFQDEKGTFNFFNAIKFPDNDSINDCFSIDVTNELANNVHVDICPSDPLEFLLANSIITLDEVHDTDFGTHLNIEEYYPVDRSKIIKNSQKHTLSFPTHDVIIIELTYINIIYYILELKIINL